LPPVNSLARFVAEARPIDVFRGVARICEEDSKILNLQPGDLLRMESPTGEVSYAKFSLLHQRDESMDPVKVQIDGIARDLLRVQISDTIFISKVEEHPPFATAIELQPLDGMPENLEFDSDWLLSWIEDKPLWKGSVILLMLQDKPHRFQVTSVTPESAEVCMGTPRTKIVLPSMDEMAGKSGQLFAFNLVVEFNRKVYDYDNLWRALEKRGFSEKQWRFAFNSAVSPDLIPPSEVEAAAIESASLSQSRRHLPNIRKGRIQILAYEEDYGRTLHIGHGYDDSPFENSEELLKDMEEDIPLISQALVQDLGLNLKTDVKQIRFDTMYKVPGKKDSKFVLENAESFPLAGSPDLDHLRGSRGFDGEIVLHPVISILSGEISKTLTPKGLINVKIRAFGNKSYGVSFNYGLSEIEEFVRYVRSDSERSTLIVAALENATPSG